MTIRVIATKIEFGSLKPGDLYSDKGTDYWDVQAKRGVISDHLYIRLEGKLDPDMQTEIVYRVEIRNQERYEAQPRFSPLKPPGWID